MKTKHMNSPIIYNSDCLDIIPTLKENSIDCVITSPPYNINLKYKTYSDNLTTSEYLRWLHNIFNELNSKLKDDGQIFLNLSSNNKNPGLPLGIASMLTEFFKLQNHIIWVKSLHVDGKTHGHFKPINSDRFLNHNFEHVFHFTKTGAVKLDRLSVGVPYNDKSNIKRWSGKSDLRCNGNVWFIPYKTVQSKSEKFDHPATYPIELVTRCINLSGIKKGSLVFDPFLGSGTTLVACKELGMIGVGCEIDEQYYDGIKKRSDV